MKQYEKPTMTVEEFDAQDIIATSTPLPELATAEDDTQIPSPVVGWDYVQ